MSYSASVTTHSGENDDFSVEEIASVEDFLVNLKRLGGILFPFRNGTAPFIPVDDIKDIWFYDDEVEHVCDHCKSQEPDPPKDLTIN